MSIPAGQQDTAAFLRRLAGTDPIETHISAVFLGADTVWKLKKAVRLSFLDFTSTGARHHFAARELALNAPHAPGLYRDVVPIVRHADGTVGFGDADGPAVIDWVLRMARVPAGDFLDEIAAAGGLGPDLLDALADTVAAYHAALVPLPGATHDLRTVIEGNVRAALDTSLPPSRVQAWRDNVLAAYGGIAAWLDDRAARGFVRRAHGDLHLGNLCMWQGGPVPFDALEFDEALATIDLGYDLAFLLMDLEFRVGRAAANRVLNRYVARSGDADLVRGLPVFLSSRALIRAHVAARSGRDAEASAYLDAADAYLEPSRVLLVAIGGLPGTGKSTLARAIAPTLGRPPGALILRSDEIRKHRFGVAPEQRLPPEAYASDVSAAVFRTLAERARTACGGGQVVIADATFMDPTHRVMVQQAAQDAGVPFLGLWLCAPQPALEARIAHRTHDASDATIEVLRSAIQRDPGAGDWVQIDASDADSARDLATAAVQPHLVLP
ncbi:MAG: AAA family ATPase [Acetobacteraceae bacterium]